MIKKSDLVMFVVVCLISVTCVFISFAATHDPWDGTKWDVASPDIDQPHGNAYKEIYDLRKGVALRMNKEHETLATSSAGGVHKQGSAVVWHLATDSIPALQPNGDALDSGDNGRLWHDITTDIFYVLDNYSDPTVDGGWIEMGSYLGSIAINTDKFTVARATGNTVVAGTLTITGATTANGSITLGADDDLIGSSTSDITINANKFTVAGATGNTLVAGTLDVTGNIDPTTYETTNGGFLNHDSMTGAADNTVASSDSIVKYATLDAGGVIMHDAEGSFQNADINGTKTKVYTKYLTGTLDADTETSVAHGVASGSTKILSVCAAAFNNTNSRYLAEEVRAAELSAGGFSVWWDNTNVIFAAVGTQYDGEGYKIRIDYIL